MQEPGCLAGHACQPQWLHTLRHHFIHRVEALPGILYTSMTQLKACKTQVYLRETKGRQKEGKKERNRKQVSTKKQDYILFPTRLNRHKPWQSDLLNPPSCCIFPLISCNCNTLRQSSPLVGSILQLTSYPEGEDHIQKPKAPLGPAKGQNVFWTINVYLY